VHYLVSDHTFGLLCCWCKQVWREYVRHKTTCFTSVWWSLPRLVDLASKMRVSKQFVPQVPDGFFHNLWFFVVNWRIQKSMFHMCLVGVSTTCGVCNLVSLYFFHLNLVPGLGNLISI